MAPSNITPETNILFITGATQGIGLQIARQISTPSLYKNYHVIIGALTAPEGEKAITALFSEDPSRSISTVTIDVTSDSSIEAAKQQILSDFGRIDVLYNNAGVLLDGLDEVVTTRALFEKTFQVNLFGACAVTEAFIPLLEKSTASPPRIVFMTSRLGSLSVKSNPDDMSAPRPFPVYRSSKCALNMLMLHYSMAYGPRGWKVNGCDPGLTRTDLIAGQKGGHSVEDGAVNACRLITLGVDGETGTFTNKNGPIPW